MDGKLHSLFSFLILVWILIFCPPVYSGNSLNQLNFTLNQIREKIKIIKNKENIEEPQKLRILYALYATEDNLEEIETFGNQLGINHVQLKNLPDEINQLKQLITKTTQQLKPQKQEQFSHYRNSELEQRLFIEKSNLNDLNSKVSYLEVQIAEESRRPRQDRKQKAELKKRREDTYKEQLELTSQITNKQELIARHMQIDSRLHNLHANLSLLDIENIIHPLKIHKQKLELQWLEIQEDHKSSLIKRIEDVLSKSRQKEIDKVQEELELILKQSKNKHTVIQKVVQENLLYHQLLQKTRKKLKHYQNQNSEIKNQYQQLEKDFQSAEKKINLAGLSPVLGNHLRDQHRHLPLLQDFNSTINLIQNELALTGLKIFQLDESRHSLIDIEQNISSKMETIITPEMDIKEKLRIRSELRGLLNQQKEQVSNLNSIFSNYSRTLADVDFSLNQLMTLGETYSNYLDERLLWVPSAPVINKYYLSEISESILWFFKQAKWQQVVVDAKHGAESRPVFALIMLFMIFLLFWFRPKIKSALKALLEKSAKLYSDKFEYTFYSLGYAFLLALPYSFLIVFMGGLIVFNDQSTNFSHSVAHGLWSASVPLLLMQFFYQLFKPAGVVCNLFNWNEQRVQLIYRQLKWLRFIIIPGIFTIGTLVENASSKHSDSLGRISLIIIMMALLYALHSFSHPKKGLAKDFYQIEPDNWISRLRYIWYGILVSTPLLIIGFAIAGYYQSALELENKLIILLRLIFFSVLFHEIVMRGMILANRQLALQNARQKRKQHEQAEAKDNNISTNINPEEELILDIPKINEQNRKLLSATIIAILLIGSWLTLHDILPAFSIFNKVVLWQHMTLIDGKETLQAITLINVFFSVIYLALMLVFTNNFSGLIDLLFVGRYSMTAGGRYALVQLTRYIVIAISFIAIANELGGSWSQVQWLVAALSVGLGFGLQEIFANMVSGIILLFERPIRVGDTVTIGDVSGKVSRIQMRATTITDWDQKELVVPNKTFITEKLVNWTLTDTITRMVIPVGVAYDSDDMLVQQILEQVVAESPFVLDEPEPTVYFLGLGDSSLDYEIRIFMRELGDRLPAKDDVHKRIRQAFKQHNIEIPFPQRDLHIRSSVIIGND